MNAITEEFINVFKEFSIKNFHIESVIIVGSYHRGTDKKNSDLDLIIITSDKARMVANQKFIEVFGDIEKKQTEYYGRCTSIRVWYKNGLEVEFGIVEPSWIEKPLDAGTYKVLNSGYRIVVDKKHYFENLRLTRQYRSTQKNFRNNQRKNHI